MADITAVSFVPKVKRAKLRHVLSTSDTGDLRWFERKRLFCSEFHFIGPADLVLKTHAFIASWLASSPR